MKLLFLLFGCLALGLLVQGQNQSGFISIDCGIAEGSDYVDDKTSISYTSDVKFIDTGTDHNISQDFMSNTLLRQLSTVRSFSQGIKNCYTFKPPQAAKDNNFLIRAYFMYGNYDSKNQPPEFSLYLEADEWDIVKLANASDFKIAEIIHVPATDYIHVCLVNTGSGTPFISALELRLLNNTIYKAQSGSLALSLRIDVGSTTNQIIRYKDDVYDRIWKPNSWTYWQPISASYESGLLSGNEYKPPSSVMMTAARPVNGTTTPLDFSYKPDDPSQKFYLYMHFSEVEKLQANQLRKFDISLNGDVWRRNVVPSHLSPLTIYSKNSVSGQLMFSFNRTSDSTLPPILNALEIYMVKEFLQSPTNQNDVDAIRNIKSEYRVERNWQGDPCAPKNYLWDGLECSYDPDSTTITSLKLSCSALSGDIVASLSSLKSLQNLDLSNNSLAGPVPDFLSQLPFLKSLNLAGNQLSGSVPLALIQKSKKGSLSLRTDGNPNLCQAASCKTKKGVIIPVIASLVSCLILSAAILAILWGLKRRRQRASEHIIEPNEMLESKNRHYTYPEVINITSNFRKVIGKGGFGTVYAGYLIEGCTQVAVKMLSESSTQGSKQFLTEAQLLSKIHHRNLVSLLGYCNEGQHMGLIYEYMANGNLEECLSEKSTILLNWEQRLRIAVDSAQALEYLHNGCKPLIIHRDIKTSNILLTEKLQAKLADFGISRSIALNGGTHVSTAVAGTRGYLDPEYHVTSRLNDKSDVYSFGIVLLELITGQRPIIESDEVTHIVQWVQPMLERAEINKIVDSRLKGDFDTNSAWKAVEIAMACVPRSQIQRPNMSNVVAELKECLEMEIGRGKTWKTKEEHNSTFSSSVLAVVDLESSMDGPSTR